MSLRIFLSVLLLTVLVAGSTAASPVTKPVVYKPLQDVQAKYDAAIKKAEAEYAKAAREARQAALKEVTALVPQAVKTGDLEAANAVNGFKEKLQEEIKADPGPPSRADVAAKFVGKWSWGSNGLVAKANGTLVKTTGQTGTWTVTGPQQVTVTWTPGGIEVVDFRLGARTTYAKDGHTTWLKDPEKGD